MTYDDLDVDTTSIGDFELSERQALRRVEGLSTELEDISEAEYRQVRLERVVLVGVWTEGSAQDVERSMTELARLAETAGSNVLEALVQRRDAPDPSTFIGSGKVMELREAVVANRADTVICDGDLTPSQLRTLEERLKVKVVDRTWLILDIFAQHARSKEGKAQVTLAQLQYLLPRLRGWGEAMSRQAGGIGTRGAGETKIEMDRRRIRDQIAKIRRELKDMERTREVKRLSRKRSGIPQVAIAGYTNAGKSSLLNRMTGAGVLVENALFATLDPTVRKTKLPSGREITLADTVGFVRHLPHQLVEAFRSTLEEVAQADLILHIVDGADESPESQIDAVREVLAEIEAAKIPELIVINKIDAADPVVLNRIMRRERNVIGVSAKTGEGIEELLKAIEVNLPGPSVEVRAVVPYTRGDLVSRILEDGVVFEREHREEGTFIHAKVDDELAADLAEYAE